MIYAFVFLIGSATQFVCEFHPTTKTPFDYEPPHTIRKIRPCLPIGKRVIEYPVATE
jgi:hypothetical protein